jgi:hypothetical protein
MIAYADGIIRVEPRHQPAEDRVDRNLSGMLSTNHRIF